MAVLLEVTLRKLLSRISGRLRALPPVRGLLAEFTAPSGRDAIVVEAQLARRIRIVFECRGRLRHLQRIFQHTKFARIADAMMLEWFQHFELEASSMMRLVVRDLRPLEHEADRVIGQVNAHGHFGIALIGPIAEARKSADAILTIVKIVKSALVEIRLAGVGMHQVIGFEKHDFPLGHDSISYLSSCMSSTAPRDTASNRNLTRLGVLSSHLQIGVEVARIRDLQFVLDDL